jgi:hypothetical protein
MPTSVNGYETLFLTHSMYKHTFSMPGKLWGYPVSYQGWTNKWKH